MMDPQSGLDFAVKGNSSAEVYGEALIYAGEYILHMLH